MTDEKYIFLSEIGDKKRTARGSFNKVRGPGRKVMFPSDYMSEKERNAMNSAVTTYDLAKPMKWAEFCAMPDDLRRDYILRCQKVYRAGDAALGEMMGVSKTLLLKQRKMLGIESVGRGCAPLPEWESFLKYGTPTREASAVKDLIPPELREKLDRYEQEHPHVKANVDNCKAEHAPAEPVPCESAPVTNVLDRRMVLDIAYSAGALYALAGACSDSGAAVLNTAAEKLWNIATAVSVGEGKNFKMNVGETVTHWMSLPAAPKEGE